MIHNLGVALVLLVIFGIPVALAWWLSDGFRDFPSDGWDGFDYEFWYQPGSGRSLVVPVDKGTQLPAVPLE